MNAARRLIGGLRRGYSLAELEVAADRAMKDGVRYAYWLAHIAGRTGSGPGAGASSQCVCPSCHQPVIKRQLTKVFFT